MAEALDTTALDLDEAQGGTRLRLKVKAGARGNVVLGVHAGALKLSVTTAPERGKANKAVLRLLADRLALSPSSLQLLSGPTSPDKTVLVPLSPATIRERLR
jgi:uncharacterized protein YggU (UPF0235/DUF167 family)